MTSQPLDLSPGRISLAEQLTSLRSGPLQFPPVVNIVDWIETHGRLSKEVSAEPGEVRLYGYQKGMALAMAEPGVRQVTVLKGARIGYSQVSSLVIAYMLGQEGTSVLVAQPTDDDAKDFAKTNLDTLFRDVTPLREIVRTITRSESQDTWSDRIYRNGAVLKIRGAASDDAFRRITTRINVGDEVDADAWRNTTASSQGDKFKLLETRGATFWNSKLIVGSTPLLRDTSLIYREWLLSDQRRYYVPCPYCQEMQYLKWGGKDVAHGIKWSVDEDGRVTDAWYVCEHCETRIDERHKASMDAAGEWRPTAIAKKPGNIGFHCWAGMSLFPKAGWKYLAQEWLEAQGNADLLQPFINLVLGEPFDALQGKVIQAEGLAQRREAYPAEVPDGVVAITAGIDVQSGSENQDVGSRARLEMSIWGWGRGEESWLISHQVLDEHEPFSPESQKELDEILQRPLLKRDGSKQMIQACAIDIGGGYGTEVKDFCRTRSRRNVWAIKGRNGRLGTRTAAIWPRKPSRKDGNAWYMIDSQLSKDVWSRRLKTEAPGPGFVHFPMSADEAYFAGLTAEKLVIDKRGNRYWQRKKSSETGEAWDCAVYALAALQGLKIASKAFKDLSLAADRMNLAKVAEEYDGPDRSAGTSAPLDMSNVKNEIKPEVKQPVAPQAHKPVARPRSNQVARSNFVASRRW